MDRVSPAKPTPRSATWRWYICGLLLLATTINYMDRQTLSTTQDRIRREFGLNKTEYGHLELGFGWAFATGAITFGIIADRMSVRVLYPIVLSLWSLMGFLTGFAETYTELLVCRTLLGLFEAGHWPCALKTTQRLLSRKDRTMGNSILQSGSSVGAIVTPILMNAMLTSEPGSWRFVFQAIGGVGFFWVFLWLGSIRKSDLTGPPPEDGSDEPPARSHISYWDVIRSRRFVVLLAIVFSINVCWHFVRVWLQPFLMEGRGYTETEANWIIMLYYIATDVGSIAAGFATLALCRRGQSVFQSRKLVYLMCAILTSFTLVAASTPQGWPLVAMLMVVGVGALGIFPCYYSFSQELSVEHQGKVSGLLGTFAWLTTSPLHSLFGYLLDQKIITFNFGIAMVGCIPLVAYFVLILLWNTPRSNPAGEPKLA